jgi:A/G-specific adenine glycosylase
MPAAKPRCVLCPWQKDCAARAGGFAEDLPVPAEKPERPLRQGVVFWLQRGDGAVLLRRREERGLLGGMIEVPSTPWREAAWNDAEALIHAPANVTWTKLPGTVHHGFTHFPLDLTILAATAGSPPNLSWGIWARPEQFKDYAFPTLTKKIVKHALSVLPAAFLVDP